MEFHAAQVVQILGVAAAPEKNRDRQSQNKLAHGDIEPLHCGTSSFATHERGPITYHIGLLTSMRLFRSSAAHPQLLRGRRDEVAIDCRSQWSRSPPFPQSLAHHTRGPG